MESAIISALYTLPSSLPLSFLFERTLGLPAEAVMKLCEANRLVRLIDRELDPSRMEYVVEVFAEGQTSEYCTRHLSISPGLLDIVGRRPV